MQWFSGKFLRLFIPDFHFEQIGSTWVVTAVAALYPGEGEQGTPPPLQYQGPKIQRIPPSHDFWMIKYLRIAEGMTQIKFSPAKPSCHQQGRRWVQTLWMQFDGPFTRLVTS